MGIGNRYLPVLLEMLSLEPVAAFFMFSFHLGYNMIILIKSLEASMTLRELIEQQTKDLNLINVHIGAEDKVRGDGMLIIHDGTLADVFALHRFCRILYKKARSS